MRSGASSIRGVIIDLDGTMLDTVPDFEAALNGMRAGFGLAPISQAIIKPLVGKGSEKLVRDALLLDWDAARVEAAYDDAMAGYSGTIWPSMAIAAHCMTVCSTVWGRCNRLACPWCA